MCDNHIISYNKFLEALKDELLPIQAREIARSFGKKFLNYEPAEKTKAIIEGRWELNEEDKMSVIGEFFSTNISELKNKLSKLPEGLSLAIENAVIKKYKALYKGVNIQEPTLRQITTLYSNCLYQINARETDSTKIMIRDKSGKPTMGDDNKPIFQEKEKGKIVYTNNIVNINGFIESWNKAFGSNVIDEEIFKSDIIGSLKSTVTNNPKIVDFNIFSDKPMYLYISSKPKDVLNMSMSMFYTSCQNLYNGSYKENLLINVFEKNTKPAFLIFDTPYYAPDTDDYISLKGKLLSEFTAISRMLLRKTKRDSVYLDRAYPDRLQEIFENIVDKYSEMDTARYRDEEYDLEVDLPEQHGLDNPYQDKYDNNNEILTIGKNVKELSSTTIMSILDEDDDPRIDILPSNKVDTIVIKSGYNLERMSKVLAMPENCQQLSNIFKKMRYIKIENIYIDNAALVIPFYNLNEHTVGLKITSCKLTLNKLDESMVSTITDLEITSSHIYEADTISKSPVIMPDMNMFENLINFKCLYTFKELSESLLYLKNLKTLILSEEGLYSKRYKERTDLNKYIIEKLKEKGVEVIYESI